MFLGILAVFLSLLLVLLVFQSEAANSRLRFLAQTTSQLLRITFVPFSVRRGKTTTAGLISIPLWKTSVHVALDHDSAKSIFKQFDKSLDFFPILKFACRRAFNLRSEDADIHEAILPQLHGYLNESLLRSAGLERLYQRSVEKIEKEVLAIKEEIQWPAGISDSIGRATLSALMGTDFMAQYPTVLEDLAQFDAGIMYLLAGIPHWVPLEDCRRAHEARRRILDNIAQMLERNDREPLHTLVVRPEDPDTLIRAFDETGRQAGLGIESRSSEVFALVWASQANLSNTVVWSLKHIYSSPKLLTSLRAETNQFVVRDEAAADLIRIHANDLKRSSPIMRATMLETLRMYHTPWTIRHVKSTFELDLEHRKIESGSFIAIPHHAPNFDPEEFPDPMDFDPSRFLSENKSQVDTHKLHPWDIGVFQCKGKALAETRFLSFVAGFIKVWDVESTEICQEIGAKPTTGVAVPTGSFKMVLRRRKSSSVCKTG